MIIIVFKGRMELACQIFTVLGEYSYSCSFHVEIIWRLSFVYYSLKFYCRILNAKKRFFSRFSLMS